MSFSRLSLSSPSFCSYINDLRLRINNGSKLRLLSADNLQIYIQVPLDQIYHGIHLLYESSCRVAEWANTNQSSKECW